MHQGWERTRISAEALKGLSDKFGMAIAYETLSTRVEYGLVPIMRLWSSKQETFRRHRF